MLMYLWDFCKCALLKITAVLWNAFKLVQGEQQHKLNSPAKGEVQQQVKSKVVVSMANEVWTDVFGFIKRVELARTVSLTNWHIHDICWPRLHGNKVETYQIMDRITIASDRGRPPKALVLKDDVEMPLPSCPLPSYISGFRYIRIQFLDEQVLAFFTHILPCLVKSGVSITLDCGSNAEQCALLDQLLNKFKDGLPENKLHAYFYPMPNVHVQYLPNIDNKMPIINLELEVKSDIPNVMKMLASPRPDGRQRVIVIYGEESLVCILISTIKEDFRVSTQPLPQPFYICFDRNNLDVQSSAEPNEQTNEQLTIMPVPTTDDNINDQWEICRHPREQHEQWAEDGRERVQSASSDDNDYTRIHVDMICVKCPSGIWFELRVYDIDFISVSLKE